MKNIYLEKAAALGDKDMHSAKRKVNARLASQGRQEIGARDFKDDFKSHRGVGGRVVGAVGGFVVGRGVARMMKSPIPIVAGTVGGYLAGKSKDNKSAAKSITNDYLDKSAAEKKLRNRFTGTAEIAGAAYGVGHLRDAPSKLLGYHTMYHGTSKENAKSILKNGLNKSKGGTRGSNVSGFGADVNKKFVDESKKHVYMTKSKFVGRTFAGDSAKHIDKHGVTAKGTLETLKDGFKNGKVLKARVSHNTYTKGFQMDPDSFDHFTEAMTSEEKLKHIAARSKHNVGSQFFSGGKGNKGILGFASKNHLRKYYASKSGKIRALQGVAQLAGGPALVAGMALHNKYTGGVLSKKANPKPASK